MLGIVEARSTGSPNEVQILIFILNCKTVAFMVNPRNFKTSKSKGEKYNGRAYVHWDLIWKLCFAMLS